jgi:hypothetical protein
MTGLRVSVPFEQAGEGDELRKRHDELSPSHSGTLSDSQIGCKTKDVCMARLDPYTGEIIACTRRLGAASRVNRRAFWRALHQSFALARKLSGESATAREHAAICSNCVAAPDASREKAYVTFTTRRFNSGNANRCC